MNLKRAKFVISLYLFLIKEKKILLIRRQNTGYMDHYYGLVSGHLEEGESAMEGMAREAQEEAGITIDPRDLTVVHVMHRREHDERMDLFFTVKKWKGEPTNTEPDKCDDMQWFPLNSLPENTIPYIRTALENYQKNIIYSEIGW